jgi:predicted nucleic acid-binding protein
VRAYIDSDVLIWHLRGERKALAFLKKLAETDGIELWTGAMQRAEIVFFMRPEEEASTLLLLSRIKTATLDQTTVDTAAGLYRKWHPSQGIDINDALLAATAVVHGGMIYCLNTKHYPIPEIHVRKAW